MALDYIQDEMMALSGNACKARVRFKGTGTVTILSSYNVSSITDNATGNYTVNFTTALSDANYSFVFGGSDSAGDTSFPVLDTGQTGTISTTQLQVRASYTTTLYDMLNVSVVIFGD